MKKILIPILTILLFTSALQAQSHKYNRAGMTILHIEYSDEFRTSDQLFFHQYTPDSRYDVNTIQTKTLPAGWKRINISSTSSNGEKTYKTVNHQEEITNYLNKRKIGKEIISSLFNRQADGSMDLLTIHYRGQYNATDADYKESISTKRGAEALKETGELLINNSYIVVFDNQNTRYEKIGEDQDYYYRGNTVGYIYKINWTEEMLYAIWECWIDENTPENEKEARKAAFEKIQIPVSFISTYSSPQNSINTNVLAARKNPSSYGNKKEATLKAEALTRLTATGVNKCYQSFEGQNENLSLKSVIYGTHPVVAKLGTKEGLSTDYTFYVYENVQDASGNIKAKRVGVIRATNKIADNSRITTGDFEPSTFYQYAGGRIQKGQSITEKKKARSALELGATYCKDIEVNIGYEFDGYSTRLTQYFIGARGNIGKSGYNAGIYAGYGFRMNNFHLFPLVGIYADGIMGVTKQEDEKTPSASFAQLAAKANINIYYPFQLFVMAGYNFQLYENESYKKYNANHEIRNPYGFTASGGIRFCF